jgi:hypothetical protein
LALKNWLWRDVSLAGQKSERNRQRRGLLITFALPHTFLSFEYIFHILPQSTQSTQRFLQLLRALCALCGNNPPSTGGWRIIPQSTQRFIHFSVPAVGTIHSAREDQTTEHTEHTEVSPISPCPLWEQSTQHGRIRPRSTQSTQRFLQFLCARCGNNTLSTGGSDHGAHRAHRGFSISLCPLCAPWEQSTLHGRSIPQSTQSTQRFLQFLRARCALCGKSWPHSSGSLVLTPRL